MSVIQFQRNMEQNNDQEDLENFSFQKTQKIQKKIIQQISIQKIKKQTQSFYRPQIDGLRTIAVSIVVIFHAYPQFMVGGFIGVDIFFVISGYLITKIINKQIKNQKFTLSNFYFRRIKRIFPALILVLITVLLFGCWYLMKEELQILTKTMLAATIFSTNIQILSHQQSYFDPDIKTNPLLHLWSLGVQQQFYIVWPLIISFVTKLYNKKQLLILLAVVFISFTFNIISLDLNPNFSFYFPLCRFWQMAIGGLIAYKDVQIKNIYLKNLLSLIGMSAIMISIWIVNQNSLFPGFWALVPTLSAAFIILAGNQSFINKYILSSRLFVFIGKISYPLYLWHWPLLVFGAKQFPIGSTSIFSQPITMVFLSLIFSILTYYFVENPLRFSKSKKVVINLSLVMILIAISSLVINKNASQFSFMEKKIKQILLHQQLDEQGQIWTGSAEEAIRLNKFHLYINQRQKQKLSSQYQKSLVPRENDFILKNGKWYPNSSKNRNSKNATLRKVLQRYYTTHKYSSLLLQKKIQPKSKYYDQKLSKFQVFDIVNQGQDNLVMVVGDSHGRAITSRFYQLYKESVYKNKTNQFPTVISIASAGKLFIPCFYFYDSTLEMIKKHKPKRVLFVQRWLEYLVYFDKQGPLQSNASMINRCNFGSFEYRGQTLKDTISYVQMFVNTMKLIKSWGIEVFVSTVHPEGGNLEPKFMFDFFGLIYNNVKPMRLSKFRKGNKQKIDLIQTALKNADINIVDFSDHQCWEDICQVVTPSGYPMSLDSNHYSEEYSRFWGSAVDFLTQF